MSKENIPITIGKLTEDFMSYKVGATVCGVVTDESVFCFLILHDIKDKNWGYAFSNTEVPKIAVEKVLTSEKEITKFWTYFNLISYKVKIPVEINLFEN